MRILIIEDENRIAKRLLRMTRTFFGNQLQGLIHKDALDNGLDYLQSNEVDLLLLDLNLNGEDGFEVLQKMSAAAFHTIVVSAYQERAITAFEYGVLDFVPKPFCEERLAKAFQRLSIASNSSANLKYLAVQKKGSLKLLAVEDLLYIQGAGIYTELHLKNGTKAIHNKSLDKLQQILPESFERIHKSYIVDMNQVESMLAETGSKYSLVLKNDITLPIGRTRYKKLKEKWIA